MIDNTDRHFKGQMKEEEVLAFCRKHWIQVLPHLVLIALFFPIIFIYTFVFGAKQFSDLLGEGGYLIFGIGLFVVLSFLFHRLFLRIFNYYLDIFIVTNIRLVDLDKTVFFKDNRDAIDIKEIQDCEMKRSGILQTILNYGEIRILLSSVTEPIVMKNMPNPEYHFRKINKTKREYILSRQIQKQTHDQFALDRELKPLTEETKYPLTEKDFRIDNPTGRESI